jgi:hypothetical protein
VLSLGFRMDANSYSDEMSNPLEQFSPRFSLSYALTDAVSFNLNTERATVSNSVDLRIDKKWFFNKWSLNVYLDIENITGNAVMLPALILNRPLDADNKPIGSGIIENPDAPADQQRYKLKTIDDAQGTAIPSVGVMIEI